MVIQHKGFHTTTTDWQKRQSSKEISMMEHKSDTVVCDAFHLSHLSDVTMVVVLEEKAFAEFKVNEA